MANDPKLAADTCIYIEAVSGDGGAHNSSGVWWLSPDIKLTGPTSGLDKADPGQINIVDVTFHRKDASSNCTTPGDESVTIELWVGNPSLAMSPSDPASTTKIQSIGSPSFPAPGASDTEIIDWTPPSGLPSTDPQSSGHKCLIARCYPQSLTPDPDNFFVPDDPHVAQHNICIVPCSGKKAPKHGLCRLEVSTLNLNFSQEETITLRAVADLRPEGFVRRVVLERLERVEGFRRLATAAPRGNLQQANQLVHDKSQERGEDAAEDGRELVPRLQPLEDVIAQPGTADGCHQRGGADDQDGRRADAGDDDRRGQRQLHPK